MSPAKYADLTPREIRHLCRVGVITSPTAGMASGFAQANVVVIPQQHADDFERFCRLNPKPCPLIEVTSPGCAEPVQSARGADLRTDLPRYRVFQEGKCVERPTSIASYWRDDFVAFLIGCSFTFENALLQAGLPVRHIEESLNVPMYRTTLDCTPSGPFSGPMIVSMRPMTPAQAKIAWQITQRMESSHGAPIHVGDPANIGIADLADPTYGDAVNVRPDEVPVFWACGVTPMEAIARAGLPIAITHDPGCMLITDIANDDGIAD